MDAEEKKNTLGEWSDSDDDWVMNVKENTLGEWSDSDDDWIWDAEEQTGRGRKRKNDEVNETSSEDEGSISSESNFYTIEQVRQQGLKNFGWLQWIMKFVLTITKGNLI